MMFEGLTIIIVSYNVRGRLRVCLKTVLSNLPNINIEIIIIDNNSKDGTYKFLHEKFKYELSIGKIKIIKNMHNYGFSKAVNQGIKLSRFNKIILLNPDIQLQRDAFQEMLGCLKENQENTLVGGKMTKPNRVDIHGTCVRELNLNICLFVFTNLKKIFPNNKFYKYFYLKDKKNLHLKTTKVSGLSGGFLLVPKKVTNQIGILDESFFMYLEDIDYCYRAKMSSIKVIYHPKSCLVHYSGSSSKNKHKIDINAWRHSKRLISDKYLNLLYDRVIINFAYFIDDFIIDLYHNIKRIYENRINKRKIS